MFNVENLLLVSVAGLFFSLGYKYHQHLMEREEEEEYDPEDVTETYEICSSLFKYL